ncbi:hypothetical protein KBC03_00875 [Patescibacteria group bacterium]|nr:hypothetical protein [Patescibacteria group bacterium]
MENNATIDDNATVGYKIEIPAMPNDYAPNLDECKSLYHLLHGVDTEEGAERTYKDKKYGTIVVRVIGNIMEVLSYNVAA